MATNRQSGTSLIEKKVEEQVLRALQEKEAALDAAIEEQHRQQQQHPRDFDDEELERLRQQRRKQMQEQMQHLQDGHGTVTELHDEKEFFSLAKKTKLVVRLPNHPTPNQPLSTCMCCSVLLHEQVLALWRDFSRKHLSIRVCAINAEKAPFLTDRLKIWCLPTAVLVRDSQTQHSIVGLDEVGGERLSLSELEDAMRRHKMLPPE
ncbi:thioredoxin domain-containing protein 9 [Cyclospora cayetanensis]|uniref:Thioredoxin domain-containing protein 9 n=1 Tax=Cyclospora cayetanensis TaxID=88456 RepID=A0A6P6S0W0_9EIME|nr:thioredoxin domain-containing protein 9 [Cyclospora cayetanensis]